MVSSGAECLENLAKLKAHGIKFEHFEPSCTGIVQIYCFRLWVRKMFEGNRCTMIVTLFIVSLIIKTWYRRLQYFFTGSSCTKPCKDYFLFFELFGVTLVKSVVIVCLPFEQDTIMCCDCILYYLEFFFTVKVRNCN